MQKWGVERDPKSAAFACSWRRGDQYSGRDDRRGSSSWALGAAALAALVASGSAMLDTALALVIGFFVTRSVIGTQTFVQLRAPDSMRGRTLSVHGLISRGSPALGALGTGWAFDHVGLTLPVLFATGLVLIAVIAGIPAMRALGNPEPGDR